MTAILVMLNNFFHDLTSALWFVSVMVIWYLDRAARTAGGQPDALYMKVFPVLVKTSLLSLGLNLVFGVIRAWAYRDFEYLPAAGKGQITALYIKHFILFSIVLVGITMLVGLYRKYRKFVRR